MKVQKISLETIASEAGVHKATVSRALRNHPTIPAKTRERVQKIANELGYRPNPLVSMFQAQARAHRPQRLQAKLGWINDYPNARCWQEFPWLRGYYEGARERCETMGYQLEQLDLGRNGASPSEEVRRVSKQMAQNGIYGIILPLILNAAYLETPWKNCVVSVIGGGHHRRRKEAPDFRHLHYPQGFPSADRDLFFNARLTFHQLTELGYSRIGFVYSAYLDNEAHGRAHAGFLIEQGQRPKSSRIPILFLEKFKEGRPAAFDEWMDAHKPDVIICVNPVIRLWVESLGLEAPKDIGLANLNLVEDVSDWSGVTENHGAVGAAAVDLILSALSRNELGLNPEPRKILVPGRWVSGETLRHPQG